MNGKNCNCNSGEGHEHNSHEGRIEHNCSCGNNHKGSDKMSIGLNIIDEKTGELEVHGCGCGGDDCGCQH